MTEIAARYRDKPWVLYSVFNEPAFISWSEWRPVAEQLVDTVRDQHPEALILVSGVDFASELEGALSDPVRRDGNRVRDPPVPLGRRVLEEGGFQAFDDQPGVSRGMGIRRRTPGEHAQIRGVPGPLLRGAGARLDRLDLGPRLDAEHVHLS